MRNVTSIVLGSGIPILETPRGWRENDLRVVVLDWFTRECIEIRIRWKRGDGRSEWGIIIWSEASSSEVRHHHLNWWWQIQDSKVRRWRDRVTGQSLEKTRSKEPWVWNTRSWTPRKKRGASEVVEIWVYNTKSQLFLRAMQVTGLLLWPCWWVTDLENKKNQLAPMASKFTGLAYDNTERCSRSKVWRWLLLSLGAYALPGCLESMAEVMHNQGTRGSGWVDRLYARDLNAKKEVRHVGSRWDLGI